MLNNRISYGCHHQYDESKVVINWDLKVGSVLRIVKKCVHCGDKSVEKYFVSNQKTQYKAKVSTITTLIKTK